MDVNLIFLWLEFVFFWNEIYKVGLNKSTVKMHTSRPKYILQVKQHARV